MPRLAMNAIAPPCARAALLAVLGLLLAALAATATAADARPDCRVGIYQLENGGKLDVRPADDGHMRWRLEDGTTGELTRGKGDTWTSTLGWTGRPDGNQVTFDCGNGAVNFAGTPGKRIPLQITDTIFEGTGVRLAGRLVMPPGNARVPIVVLVHGSEHGSARKAYPLQDQLPAEGIGAFVYDKRGTGASGGTYTQDYLLLAEDAIAALHEARRLAGARAGRMGYRGASQGGWVAPLAAKIEPVDFVVVGFGLAVSPLDEDREAVALNLSSHGYGADVLAKGREVSDAVATIIRSGFRGGYDRLAAVRARYGKEPWFKYVRGDITWFFLENTEATLRDKGPVLLAGVPADYDPMPVLRNLDVPQLWMLAADDDEAPSAETARRLRALQAAGKPVTLAVFPRTIHGIYEYETTADGKRLETRNPDGYFRMMRDFILDGRLPAGRYGDAAIDRPRQMDSGLPRR